MIKVVFLLVLVTLAPMANSQPVLELDSEIPLYNNDPAFGGFSAIHVQDGGQAFVAVSDRGHFLVGTLSRTNGHLVRAEFQPLAQILDSKGQPLDGLNTDAEGLAIGTDGALYVSFEGNHRIMRHSTIHAAATFLPKHPDFRTFGVNSGLEALATDAYGTIYAIPERSGELNKPFPVYRYVNGEWDSQLQIDRQPPFLVVGADILDGYLYVLERHLAGLAGFSSRIRRFPLDDLTAGEVLLTTPAGRFDNLEGISMWRDESGTIRATLISDDNFRFFQRNQMVEFMLRE